MNSGPTGSLMVSARYLVNGVQGGLVQAPAD